MHLPYQHKITSALAGATFSDCSPPTVTKIAALISDLGFSFPHSRTVRPPPAIFLQLMSLFIHLFCLLASIFRLWSSPLSLLFLKDDKCCFTPPFLISFLCLITWDSSYFNSVLWIYPTKPFCMQALRTAQYCGMKRSTAYFLFCMRFSLYVRTAFYWLTSHFHSSVCFTLSLQRILRP